MKLDQKQMHLVSQLFMAAGKAGQPFDLGQFMRDTSYANQTMAQLALLAEQKQQEPLQGLVISVMELLSQMTPSAASAELASSAPPPFASSASSLETQQYVGKLR